MLVLLGCGSVVFGGAKVSNLEIAFCFGGTLTLLIYSIGPISGCHLNPAISLSMLLIKKISLFDALMYMFFQCFGSIMAALVLYIISLADFNIGPDNLGQNFFIESDNHSYNVFVAFLVEIIFSIFFIFIVLSSSNSKYPQYSGFLIGFSLFVIHLVGISLTGVSVNPARSIGPALIVGGTAIKQLWIFICAPLAGAFIAAGFYMINEVNKKFDSLMNS